MKVAVAAEGPSFDDKVSERFGRCAYFLLVETDTSACQALANPRDDMEAGLGLQAAWIVVNQKASVAVAGGIGSNARRILQERGVRIVDGLAGLTVRQALEHVRSAGADRSVSLIRPAGRDAPIDQWNLDRWRRK